MIIKDLKVAECMSLCETNLILSFFLLSPSLTVAHRQERPFTHNVILMMAPSVRAVITLGLFYCPNHKLSTPRFIKLD